MRKWFERRKGNGGEDGEKEDTIDESGGRSVSDPKYPKEKGSSLGVFRRKSKNFTLTSGNSSITEVEHDPKVKELVDKADEVTLLSMKLDREIKRILYIVKEEENSQQIMWMRKTVPLLFVLMGRGKDEECSGLEELLVLLSHPSAEPEQVQTDSFCGSFNSTAGKNNGDDGSAEAVGEISRRPSSHDWIDKLVVSETGLCDHLISLSSHPDFTQRCVEANLPSNLFHCIRIVAVVEYEAANPWGENDLIDMNPEILQLLSKLTKNITSRLATLLVTLCSSDDELVLEDIKHHIRRLLSIAVSSCPKHAIHLQIAASEVVCALASRISSPLIWYIHSNQIVFDMVHNLRMLMGDTTPSNSKDQLQSPRKSKAGKGMLHSFHRSRSCETETLASSVKTKKHQYAKEVPIEFRPAKGSSSFRLTKSRVNLQESISPCSSPASVNYVQGTLAEASGMWLAATKAVVAVIRPRSSYSKQLFMDFENAGGCKVLLSLLKSSVGERLSQMLDQLIILSTSRDRGTLVTNYSVFQIVSEMLISCTPILSSVSGDDGLVNTVKLLADDTLLIVAQLAIGESRRRMMLSDEEREELLNGDEVRMRIVQAILSIYSVNPQNYVVLECRYHLLSSCIACLPFFESVHLKAMVVKVLEVVCVMFRNVEPTEALKCTLTTFATCVGEILDLIATWRDQYILPLEKEESATEAPKASSKGDNEVSSPTTAIGKGLMDVNVVLTDAKILNADAELLCELFEKILQFDVKKYESIFADAGLIDAIMLPLLARARELSASLFSASEMFSNTLRSSTLKAADCSLDILTLLCNALCSMISASPHLGCAARDQGICEELHKIIEKNGLQAAKAALKVLEQVVLCNRSGLKDELDFMLKLVQKAEYEGQYKRQVIVLLCIGGLLAEGNFEVKDAWREVSGFEVIVGLFLGFDRAFPIEATDSTTKIVPPNTAESGSGSIGTLESTSFLDDMFSVIEASFSTLICAMSAPPDVFDKRSGYRKNREHMAKCIQYGLLASRLYDSGAPLHPRFAVRTVNLVFQMVTEQHLDYITITTLKPENDDKAEEGNYGIVTAAQPDVFENSTVRNADAVNVLLHLLPTMPRSLAIPVIDSLLTIVHAGGVAELRELGAAGVIRSAASLVTIARLPVFPSKTTVSVDEKEISGSETVAAATEMPPSSFLLRDNTINGMVDSYSRAIWERSKILGISPQLGPSVDIVPRLLDLVITISAHVITGPDLRIVIQAVVFPLLISKYGESLRLGRLLGWTGMSCGLTDSRIAAENHLVLGNNEDFESTEKKWDQLDILISIATGPSGVTGDGCAGSVPYLRLGGPNNTLNLNSIGGPISSSLPKNGKSSMSDASHMQLMEKLFFSCAREEVHMVHVVDLQGSKYSSQGTIAGTSTERGTRYPWPGQAGYGASFWVRINLSTSSKSSRLLESLKSWSETGSGTGNIQYVERFSYANSDSTFGEDSSSHFDVCDSADENETGTTPSSTQDTNKRKIYKNGDNLVWIVSFSSVNGKAYLSLYMDTVEHALCVQSSSAPDGTEFRSKPLTTLKMSGCDAWHHIAFSHVKRSMIGRKMQRTTDAFHLWVDGEEVALFSIDIPSYSSQGVPPTATFGIPVPQLFCDPSIKLSTIPLWHLGPTIVTCQPLPTSTASAMFIAGPSYSGVFSGENLRSGCSAITTTTILRRLLNYGVLSEMCLSQDGVNQALSNRSLQDFAKLLTYTDRNVLREKWDRSFMKEVLYDVIKLDSVAIWLSAQYSKPVSPTASTAAFKSGLSSIFPAPSLITNRIDVLHCSGAAAVYGGYGAQAIALPQPLPIALESIGGPVALYPLLFMAQTDDSIAKTLRLLSAVIRGSDASTNIMHGNLGYVFIAHILREKRHCLGPSTVDACLMLAADCVAETAADNVQPKDWDRELSIMDREKTAYVAKGNSMGFGIQGKELSRGELILITEVCALKHLLLNHQVWGERNSPLLLAVLTRLNRLVSPSNCHAFCSFNAQMLHRTGLVRWILHILIEQRDELDLGIEATQDELTTTVMSSSAGVAAGGSFAHFSPVAGIAACGLEHRDEFTVLCTLLLQRVLVINVIPRDFDRIVGATTSLKMNTRFSQFRPPGSEPASLEQEKIMQKIGILPEEGSLGTVALARGDVVKMYLLRMLFETLSVSGGLVKEGEVVCGPQPCSAVADLLECTDEPVHCMYEGKQKNIIQMCTKSLKPEWFLCLLDIVTDEAGLTAILQLLCFLMQQVPKFAIEFNEMNGFELLETVIRQFHSSLPVLLPVVALLMHLPISGIPLYASANTMGPKVLEELFDSTPGPRINDLSAVNCMLRVLLPSLDVNLTILRAETRGGDTVRAKTVALFLLNLFYNTWTRLSKFHLLMFEPGLVGAISKCAKTAWTKPNANIENVPCGEEILKLIIAILYESIKIGSPSGSVVFNVVIQILTGGGGYYREQRSEDSFFFSISKGTADALDEFHCHVVDSLVGYCRSMKVEIKGEVQMVDEMSTTQHQEQQHSSLICTSLDDASLLLDNFIGATSATVAALLFTDNDCSIRLYRSVMDLCLSIMNSPLWSYLTPLDDGDFRTSVIVMMLRTATVSMLKRATIGVIGSGNDNSSSRKKDDDEDSNSSLKCGDDKFSMQEEFEEELPPSSSCAVLLTDVHSLVPLFRVISSNLDVLLPLDLPLDDEQEEEDYLKSSKVRTKSTSSLPSSSISDDSRSRHNQQPSNSLHVDSDSSPCSLLRQRAITFMRPISKHHSIGTTSKLWEGISLARKGTERNNQSFAVLRRTGSKDICTSGAFQWNRESTKTGLSNEPFFQFALKICKDGTLVEKLIAYELVGELLSLLVAVNDINGNGGVAKEQQNLVRDGGSFSRVKEEILDLITQILSMQNMRMQALFEEYKLNISEAAKVMEELEDRVRSTLLSSLYLSDDDSICERDMNLDNDERQETDGGDSSRSTSPETKLSCSSLKDSSDAVDALKEWLSIEAEELLQVFRSISNEIEPQLLPQLGMTVSEALLSFDQCSFSSKSDVGLAGSSGAAIASAKRAEIVSRTYLRVGVSHKRWRYAGLDGMIASKSQWCQWQGRFQGGFSLWEGGIFSLVVGGELVSPLHFAPTSRNKTCIVSPQGMFDMDLLCSKKWRLDLREAFTPSRTRFRLIQNRSFFTDYDVQQYDDTLVEFKAAAVAAAINQPQPALESTEDSTSSEVVAHDNNDGGVSDTTDLENFLQKFESCSKPAEESSNIFDDDSPLDEILEFEEDDGDERSSIDDGEEEESFGTEGISGLGVNTTSSITEEEVSGEAICDRGALISSDKGITLEFEKPTLAASPIERGLPKCSEFDEEDVSEVIGTALPTPAAALSSTPGIGETSKELSFGFKEDNTTSGFETEVFSGFLDPVDWPAEACFNASRILGLEVRPCVAIICKHALYVVTGYSYKKPTEHEMKVGSSRHHSKFVLSGLRRVEQKTRGAPGGMIHGEQRSRFKVTLRRPSIVHYDKNNGMAFTGAETKKREYCSSRLDDSVHNSETDGEQQPPFSDVVVYRSTWGKIHAVYKRRYELREVGTEVFDAEGSSVFIMFDSRNLQEQFLTSLLMKPLKNSVFYSGKSRLWLPRGSTPVHARVAYKRSMKALRQEYTKKWLGGGMTNFDYLMALNVLAGRSFNDITQYPVFPWVVADYESEELDLTDVRSFRDLSKPMGAIGDERAAQFMERYEQFTHGISGEKHHPPPFFYGTHYSCAGYVLHYLLRLEPFSHLALALQGGIFDKADRLFSDIKSSWDSASKKNLQDVRELIPEFYYLAEFLVNSNHFDYGVTQLGSTVDNVELPPWAKGDPREFVRVNRKALESDYVSENLHHWIDLIFGYKQRGEEAVKAANVFVHLTYEGEVDVDSIDDPTLRESAIAQINNFGQTPSRLFNQPHPQRDIPLVIYDRNCDVGALTWHEQSTPPMCIVGAPSHIGLVPVTKANAIGYYGLRKLPISDAIYLPDNNRIIAVGKGSVLYRPEVSDDIYVRFNSRIAPEGICFYSAAHSFGKGTISDRLISYQSGLHRGAISAAVCTQGGLLVTGGEDAAMRIWDWLVLNPYGNQQMESSTKSLRLRGVLSGHSSTISCLAACETCSLVVSGGEDGNVLMWDLWNCSFIRHLPGHSTSIKGLSINESNGNTVTFAGTVIRVWTINGDLLARYTFNDSNVSSPTCVCSTNCPDWQDGAAILVGHENGDVTVWGIQWSRSTPIGPMKIAVRRCSGQGGLLIEDGKTTDEWIMSTIDSDVKGGLLASHLSPPHEMTLRRVLHSAHSTPITCVRTVGNQGILIGDSKGVVSRWMSIRLNEIPVDEALELIAA